MKLEKYTYTCAYVSYSFLLPYNVTWNFVTSVLVYYVAILSAYEIKIHYSLFVAVASLNPVVEEHKPPQILDTNKGTYLCICKLLCIL